MPERNDKHTVLVVDDDRGVNQLINLFLTRAGYNVIAAESADSGIEALRAGGVDIVLMDVMMPNKSGYQAIEEIQADPEFGDVPIIVMTARAVVKRTSPRFLSRTFGFLMKPFTSDALIKQVETVLRSVGIDPAENPTKD